MKKHFFILLAVISLASCKSAKTTKIITKKKDTVVEHKNSTANSIINHAVSFEGVRYKYGGTTKKGMDCSGLIYVSFKKENIDLPRMSRDMAKRGTKIKIVNVKEGDLLFFKTSKSRNVINHVGLVTKVNEESIRFIHATTSKGVLTSSLSERYWKNAFVEARRFL